MVYLNKQKNLFPGLANSIWGPGTPGNYISYLYNYNHNYISSLIPGVKNVLGGVLAMDKVHSQCVQKSICEQFSDEIIDTNSIVEENSIKRSYVPPKVIKERGRLRWIGDMFFNTLGKFGRKIGIIPTNRRQSSSAMGTMYHFAKQRMDEIPKEAIVR